MNSASHLYNAMRICVLCCALYAGAWACSAKSDILIPETSLRIAVAGFAQPAGAGDLLAGYVPESVSKIEPQVFSKLNEDFAKMLANASTREFTGHLEVWSVTSATPKNASASAFSYWMQIGQIMQTDLLLVPQIIMWHDRVGGDYGVGSPAAVTMDFFLLDIKNKILLARSRYDELQRPLLGNLLDLDKFMERGGKWVTARQLAQEGMYKAIKEFGL